MAADVGDAPSNPPVPRIAWSKEQQGFIVVATDLQPRPQASRVLPREPLTQYALAWEGFASFQIDGENGEEMVDWFITLREDLLDCITQSKPTDDAASSPLLQLPKFVVHWHRGLEQIVGIVGDSLLDLERLWQEFHCLAETAMQVGNVLLARSALGQCIRLARKQQAPHAVERNAKRLLLQCVQYQHERERCEAGLQRLYLPREVISSILNRLRALHSLAPCAVDVMALQVQALTAMHRSEEVVALLAAFAFRHTSARLTLAYATALEYEGFYHESIAVARRFDSMALEETTDVHEEDGASRRTLAIHASRLMALLNQKATGDDALAASQFDIAERAFGDALRIVNPQSKRLRALLLLGRANALIALERAACARKDLEESLRLDPSNQMTRLRLRTVELAQESEKIRRRMQE